MAQLQAVLVALVLLVGGGAFAQAPAAPPPVEPEAVRPPEPAPSAPPAPSKEPRPQVRSSHTVDVIAPGEKVDTILGRMRMERPAPPPRGEHTVRPPPGPESRKPQHGGGGPGHTGHPRPGEGGRAPPPPRTDGTSPPPTSPLPPPPR